MQCADIEVIDINLQIMLKYLVGYTCLNLFGSFFCKGRDEDVLRFYLLLYKYMSYSLSVRLKVLPDPGPAMMSRGCSVVSTASFWGNESIRLAVRMIHHNYFFFYLQYLI